MRVRGKVNLEDITLLVDVEAPDDEKELWVTNVHPNCLVIPRERWRVEYLGLPEEILAELKEKGVESLDDLLEPGTWILRAGKFSPEAGEAVLEALRRFQEIALLSEKPTLPAEVAALKAVPLPEAGKASQAEAAEAKAGGNGEKGWYTPDTSLDQLALEPRVIKILRENRGVEKASDLLKLGRKVAMTKGLTAQNIREVRQVLGLIRETPPEEEVSEEDEAQAEEARQHLADQGLRRPE